MNTAQTIEPDFLFTCWTPDSVAECMNVGEDLYRKIWEEIVPLLESKYEDSGEVKLKYEVPEIYESETLSAFWDKFTPEEQTRLNNVANEDD